MLIKQVFSYLSPAGERGKLSILIFHRVLSKPDPLFLSEPDVTRFDTLMGWIKDWFTVLPLDEALVGLDHGKLPARAAVITFDDGYADNYTLALPVLKKHGLTATFFVASGFLNGGRMWNDTIIEAVRRSPHQRLDFGVEGFSDAPIGTTEEKRTVLDALIPVVKHMETAVRSDAVDRIAQVCDASLPDDLMLTDTELRSLRDAGMLIGAHTVTHPILLRCSDQKAEEEIVAGKQMLEAILGERIRFFAYPNGKPGADYDDRDVEIVGRSGFDAALSTAWGVNTRGYDQYQLRRFTPWDQGRLRFALRLMANTRYGKAGESQ